jgi:hypothetical protein
VTRRAILHVGSPKTGTTYLQDILWGSRDALEHQGFRLPLRIMEDHFFLTLALRDRLDPAVDPPNAVHVLDRLRKELRKPSPHDLLFSHELLAPVAPDRIDELMEIIGDREVHVVVTARDLARQVPAEWQEKVKTRGVLPYPEFVDRVVSGRADRFWSVQDVASVAQRWGGHLPPEQVHIVTVPPAGASPEQLVSRFCDAVGLLPDELSRAHARANPSLGYEQAELLRRVNVAIGDRLPHPRDAYRAIVKVWFAEHVLADQPRHQKLGLPQERWDWAVTCSKEMVVRIERSGFRVHGDLSDLIPVCETTEPVQSSTEGDLAAACVDAIAQLLVDRNRKARRSWAGRLADDLRCRSRSQMPRMQPPTGI